MGLVLAAALFHAAWNRILHDTGDRVATMAVAGIAAAIGLLPAIIVAPPVAALPYILPSALAETAYALCLAAAYRRGAMSLAYPIGRGTAPLLVTLGGWLVLAQRPTPQTVIAALALVAGLVLVATAGQHKTQHAAIGFALLTGVCIAGYSLIDARAVQQTSPLAYLGLVMGLQGLLLTLLCGDRRRLRRVLRPGLLVAVGTTAAYLLVLFAFQLAVAGRVSTLREISVLIGVLIAREKSGTRVWLGAALVVIGAVLAAL
ncbi:MAG: EamA family transporter [Chloroflexota bacterium]